METYRSSNRAQPLRAAGIAFSGLGFLLGLIWFSPLAMIAFAIALFLLVKMDQQFNIGIAKQDIPKVFGYSALALIVVGVAAIAIQAPVAFGEFQQQRVEEQVKADNRHHGFIASSVFQPLGSDDPSWPKLRSRWAEVNNDRVKAAEWALDHQSCSPVISSDIGEVNPLTIVVTCDSGDRFAFNEDALSNGADGTPLPRDAGESEAQLNAERVQHCLDHPDSFGHSFMCSDVPAPPKNIIVVIPRSSSDQGN